MLNALTKFDGNESFAAIPLGLLAGWNAQQLAAQQQLYQEAYNRARAQVVKEWDEWWFGGQSGDGI